MKPSDDKPQSPKGVHPQDALWIKHRIPGPEGAPGRMYRDQFDALMEELGTPRSSVAENDIHTQAIYDLVRSFGWSEWSSKPPVAFIMERLAVSATAVSVPPQVVLIACLAAMTNEVGENGRWLGRGPGAKFREARDVLREYVEKGS